MIFFEEFKFELNKKYISEVKNRFQDCPATLFGHDWFWVKELGPASNLYGCSNCGSSVVIDKDKELTLEYYKNV